MLGQPQDWNAQKLAVVFGRDKADRLMSVLERERGFRQTYQDVVQGSQTAQRTAAKESLEAGAGKIPVNLTGQAHYPAACRRASTGFAAAPPRPTATASRR